MRMSRISKKGKCPKKWVYGKKKESYSVDGNFERNEIDFPPQTSLLSLKPPFVTVADAKFKSSLNFIQFPSSSGRNINFNFHLNTVADAKSLKAP